MLVLLLVAAGAPIFAADLEITYVEGRLELSASGGWKALDIGDVLSEAATVRFDGSGVAEIEGTGVKVTLRQQGTYKLSDIIGKSKQVASTGLGSLMKDRVAGVFQGTQRATSAVMGVRAAEVETDSQKRVSWLGSASDLLAQAKKELEAGEYEKALSTLGEAYENADELEEPEILYYTSYANTMTGNSGAALDAIIRARVEPAHPLHGESLLLRGQLLVEALAFGDARSSFEDYRARYPEGSGVQLADLMVGYCAKELGDLEEARRSLDRARSADPASQIGKKAQELLGAL